MNWPMCISEEFAKEHASNQPGAKFKIDEQIIFRRKSDLTGHDGTMSTVTGIGCMRLDDEGNPIFEYSVKEFPYLIWEHELEKYEVNMRRLNDEELAIMAKKEKRMGRKLPESNIEYRLVFPRTTVCILSAIGDGTDFTIGVSMRAKNETDIPAIGEVIAFTRALNAL